MDSYFQQMMNPPRELLPDAFGSPVAANGEYSAQAHPAISHSPAALWIEANQ
jgi:hypothetical protein